MFDNTARSTPTSPRSPQRRLKHIFCPKQKLQDGREMAISSPIMDHTYSLPSPTFISNKEQYRKPMMLNFAPPRVSSMPTRAATMPVFTNNNSTAPCSPRKSTSLPSTKENRRHSFHHPSINSASATSVPTAPVTNAIIAPSSLSSCSSLTPCSSSPITSTTTAAATTTKTATRNRFVDLGNKPQFHAVPSVAASSAVAPVKSRSTPLRVKTYNVHHDLKAERERQRKRKELEELIAGDRRGSTVKLTLTPLNIM